MKLAGVCFIIKVWLQKTAQWQLKLFSFPFFSPFFIFFFIWMLRRDKKARRRTDVLEVWNGLTSKPPGKIWNMKWRILNDKSYSECIKSSAVHFGAVCVSNAGPCVLRRDADNESSVNFREIQFITGNSPSGTVWMRQKNHLN